jgi:predicted HTH domain antitoxin
MKTLTIDIPDELVADDKEARILLIIKLYELTKLSLAHASDLLGISKKEFYALLSKYEVPVISYPPEELEQDLLNAKKHSI